MLKKKKQKKNSRRVKGKKLQEKNTNPFLFEWSTPESFSFGQKRMPEMEAWVTFTEHA